MERTIDFARIAEPKRLYQEVVNQVTELVLQDHLQPGDKLPAERALATQLGVSRTAVREAIRALQEKGLVDVRQGAGTFVRCPAPESVSESLALFFQTNVTRYLQLMELREILDVEIAGRLAERIKKEDLIQLRTRLGQMRQSLASPVEFAKEDAAFHMDFYRATGNEVLLMIMQPVMDLMEEAMRASFERAGSAESSLHLHEELVERVAGGDAEGARRVTKQIISRGELRMKGQL